MTGAKNKEWGVGYESNETLDSKEGIGEDVHKGRYKRLSVDEL